MPKPDLISVLVVDDHMLVRRGLGLVIDEAPGFELAGMAESGEEALHLCRKLGPDVVLMDVKMAGLGGVAATQLISRLYPEIRIIALSSFAEANDVKTMPEAGARAYLLKDVSAGKLVETIRHVAEGVLLEPDLPHCDRGSERHGGAPTADVQLGAQQIRVLALMTKGCTNPEIAEYLGISRPTVSYHVSAILRKLDVTNRSEAVAVAVQNHLIDHSVT